MGLCACHVCCCITPPPPIVHVQAEGCPNGRFEVTFFLPTQTEGMDQSVGSNWLNCLIEEEYTSRQVMPILGSRS